MEKSLFLIPVLLLVLTSCNVDNTQTSTGTGINTNTTTQVTTNITTTNNDKTTSTTTTQSELGNKVSKDEFLSFFNDISEELPKTYYFKFDQLSDITVNTTYYGDKESATTTVQKMDGKVDFAYDFTTKGDYYFRHLTDALLSDGKSKEIRQYQGFYTKTSENGYIGVNISDSQVTENEISEENLVEMVDAIIGGSIVGLGDQFKLNDEFFEELIKYYFKNSEPEFYINSQTKKATIKGYMDFDSSLTTQDTNNYTKLSGDLLMQVDEFGMINNYTIDGVINTLNKYETSSTDSHGTLVVSLVGASNENIEHTSVEPLE